MENNRHSQLDQEQRPSWSTNRHRNVGGRNRGITQEVKDVCSELHDKKIDRNDTTGNTGISSNSNNKRPTDVQPKGKQKPKSQFEKRIRLLQGLDFTPNSIISEILKIALKSFLEYSRQKTFGMNGYQQMQIDLYFMKQALYILVPSSKQLVDVMMEDIATSIKERCIEPTPLATDTIAAICEGRIEKLNLK